MQKTIKPFIFLTILCIGIQSVPQTVPQSTANDIKTGMTTIPLLSGELWWGGASNDGISMPHLEGFSYDLYDNKTYRGGREIEVDVA